MPSATRPCTERSSRLPSSTFAASTVLEKPSITAMSHEDPHDRSAAQRSATAPAAPVATRCNTAVPQTWVRSSVLTRSFKPTANRSSSTPACASSASIADGSIPTAPNAKPEARKPTSGGSPARHAARPSKRAPAIQTPAIRPVPRVDRSPAIMQIERARAKLAFAKPVSLAPCESRTIGRASSVASWSLHGTTRALVDAADRRAARHDPGDRDLRAGRAHGRSRADNRLVARARAPGRRPPRDREHGLGVRAIVLALGQPRAGPHADHDARDEPRDLRRRLLERALDLRRERAPRPRRRVVRALDR